MQVQITIRGRRYTVRSDDPEEDVRGLAAEVDARMAEVAGRTRTRDDYTIAMLTALNLASELRRLRVQVAGRLEDLDREALAVLAMIEAALPAQPEE